MGAILQKSAKKFLGGDLLGILKMVVCYTARPNLFRKGYGKFRT